MISFLKSVFNAFLDTLISRVYGHHTHPYLVHMTLSHSHVGLRARSTQFIGSKKAAVEYAKAQLRRGNVVEARVVTQGGFRVWQGTV